MEILSQALTRLVALCVVASIGGLLMPSGALKRAVGLITGLMAVEMMLQLAISLPTALGG